MNAQKWISTLLVLVLALNFQQCGDSCKVTNTYIYFTPVYSTSAEVKNSVAYEGPHTLSHLGKIYFKDGYVFINETGDGIHVIDNRNPAHPKPIGFLRIPGNYDLAIVDNVLYADSFVDLIAFDVTDKAAIREIKRIERLFDHLQSFGYNLLSQNLVLTDWKEVRSISVYESTCNSMIQPWGGLMYGDGIAFSASSLSKGSAPVMGSSGIGGSMARFTVSQNHLYALDGSWLEVINVLDPAEPIPGKSLEVAWDIETLFPYKDKLFAGSRSGMLIYDLAVPASPAYVSKYAHMISCDPVVVDDNYAYVTLRTTASCRANTINQLEVIDIRNLASPQLVSTVTLTNPHGLGIDGKTLFICDGDDGLKVYDATDVNKIATHPLAAYPGIQALDVIPYQNIAMMIGTDGLYQYDYSDPKNIFTLSKLPISQ